MELSSISVRPEKSNYDFLSIGEPGLLEQNGQWIYSIQLDGIDVNTDLDSYGTDGTLRLFITKLDLIWNDVNSFSTVDSGGSVTGVTQWKQNIQQYDRFYLNYTDPTAHNSAIVTVYLPAITAATTVLWVGTDGKTYYDSDFATLACGKASVRTISDSLAISDNSPHTDWAAFAEQL